MATRTAREPGTIARVAVVGALALVALLAGARLATATTTVNRSPDNRAVIAARNTKAGRVAAPSSRARGDSWFALPLGAITCAVLGAWRLGSIRRLDGRRDLRQLAFRLRAPPALLVVH
jgi:hypothetical protein